MTAMQIEIPAEPGRLFTVDDLDAIPYDGRRYEIVDGALFVTPSPHLPHQQAVTELAVLLRAAQTPGTLALAGPVDVVVTPHRVFAPDVVVVPAELAPERRVERLMPLLVVEVRSPSTALVDVNVKRQAYAEAGIPSYWIVDPAAPSLTAYELDGAAYAEIALVTGKEVFHARRPFPVEIVPAALVAS